LTPFLSYTVFLSSSLCPHKAVQDQKINLFRPEIAECYGSDMTKDALNHRFRTIRAEGAIIEEGRKQGFDMKDLGLNDLPKTQNAVEKNSTQISIRSGPSL
jgi:hypothetical protein